MITAAQKAELAALGYVIEDMGQEYGPEFEGAFRWLNTQTDDFQDGAESWSIDAAWDLAFEHANSH